MPKIPLSSLPVSGLFGIVKPSGPTSMSVVNDLQQLIARSKLFIEEAKLEKIKGKKIERRKGRFGKEAVKVGQGGTLDPLADGVLVIGVGRGTKKLNNFLVGPKDYRTTCLLGCETDTYDGEGSRVRVAPWRHVTKDLIESNLGAFTGDIKQVPPIFSALNMDGMRLYEYARKGIPLPRPIESRDVTVSSLSLTEWLGSQHSFSWPEKQFTEDEKKALEVALKGVEENPTVNDDPEPIPGDAEEKPSAFVLDMSVSGGTYVRSIVHDLAHAVGSAGHVVTLSRSRQGQFVLEPKEDEDRQCIPWEVFEKALSGDAETDDEGWTEWERQVMEHLVIVA